VGAHEPAVQAVPVVQAEHSILQATHLFESKYHPAAHAALPAVACLHYPSPSKAVC